MSPLPLWRLIRYSPNSPVQVITCLTCISEISTNVNSPESGVITEVFAELDEVVHVGSKLFKVDIDGKPPAPSKEQGKHAPPPKPQEVKVAEKVPAAKVEPGESHPPEKKEAAQQSRDTGECAETVIMRPVGSAP